MKASSATSTEAPARALDPERVLDLETGSSFRGLVGAAEGAPLSSRTSESRSSYRAFPPFRRGVLAFLQYRKTPLRDGGKSPAQLLLGRQLRIGIAAPSDEPSTGQITWRRGRGR